jgi:hypothetical protein
VDVNELRMYYVFMHSFIQFIHEKEKIALGIAEKVASVNKSFNELVYI